MSIAYQYDLHDSLKFFRDSVEDSKILQGPPRFFLNFDG